MFRLYRWTPDQSFQPNPFGEPEGTQDQQTVWFAGDHSDVGGGYAEDQSGAAKYPLLWMAGEARKHGLLLNTALFDHLALGAPLADGRRMYVAPSATAPIHDSMTPAWRLLEYLPKNLKWKRFPERSSHKGYYLPQAEPRKIDEGALLHFSVIERMATQYRPANLPMNYEVVGGDSPSADGGATP
jgi:hypothetical protein